MIYLLCIIAFIFGGTFSYLILRPKLNKIEKLNENTLQQNILMQEQNDSLNATNISLYEEIEEQIKLFSQLSESAKETAKETADIYYQQQLEIQNAKLETEFLKQQNIYTIAIEEALQEYLDTLKDCSEETQSQLQKEQDQLSILIEEVSKMKRARAASVDALKREEEMRTQQDFYRLVLSDIDLVDIEELRKVSKKLHNTEVLNKVIWKVYYENPCTSLIGRVVGSNIRTGIYKITNLVNGMPYVGQSADIASRWKQHIKRGLGADTPTKNKLYPAMEEFGVENFTFEIIEDCPREELSAREDYWQEYYLCKEYGYSIK